MITENIHKNWERYAELNAEMLRRHYPGREFDISLDESYAHQVMGRHNGRAWATCSCDSCENHRGRTTDEQKEAAAEAFEVEHGDLYEAFEYGPPVADSPDLWAEWPKEEV